MKRSDYKFLKTLCCLGFFLAGFGLVSLQAQDIIHPTSGTSSLTVACGTTTNYYDSGGSAGNYSASENGSLSFCPDTPGGLITISFSSVDIETRSSSPGCWDFLTITDANGTLVNGCGEQSGDGGVAGLGADDITPGSSFTSTAANGCLTVAFDSDSSINESGWEASVSCSGGSPPPGDCEDNAFTLTLNTDTFGGETSWNIEDENGNEVAGEIAGTYASNTTTIEDLCLPDGCYTLNVEDTYGDGMCCSFGEGGYALEDALGNVVASGGEFGSIDSTPFEAGAGCEGGPPPPGDCEDNALTLNLDFDDFSGETSWDIQDEMGNVVDGVGEYPSELDFVAEDICLPDGCYEFTIYDSFGDGIFDPDPGGFGMGSYELVDAQGNILAEGGEFGASETTPFCLSSTPEGPLPPPWIDINVGGAECNDYGYDEENGEFFVTGCGNNAFPLNSDNVAFAAQFLCGDSEIKAKVESVTPNGYGGLMMRDPESTNGKQVSIFTDLTDVLRHEVRYSPGTNKQVSAFSRPNPFWLKLERQGNWVFASYSTTGSNFQYVYGVMVPFGECIEVGMAAFSFTPPSPETAVFSNVMVSGGQIPQLEAGVTMAALTRQQARLFPNPAQSQVTVEFLPHAELTTYLTLRNELGQVVEERQLEAQAFRTEWAVDKLTNGVYFVEIRRDGEVPQVLRFVKSN